MGFASEFKEFALKGNVLDLAVGVIIGAAFGKIVNSIIEDVIMPIIGLAGNVDFTNAYLPLTKNVTDAIASAPNNVLGLADARKVGPVLAWGNFITITINFVILALCIFMVVKLFNTARKRMEAEKPAPVPPPPSKEQLLLTEIRDLLAKR